MKMMNRNTIICIAGEAQHGKDTTCDLILKELQGWNRSGVRIAYADYLKHLARVLYGWDGVKDEKGRTILQQLGQRVREVNPDFWVEIVERTVDTVLHDEIVVIPDSRYPNEIEYWEKRGYDVVRIKVTRPQFDNGLTLEQKQHPSETALNGYSFDYRFANTSITDLEEQVKHMLLNIGL